MGKIQVFLDTDVVISALLSKKGASYQLVSNPKLVKIVSKSVGDEILEVAKRLGIKKQRVQGLVKSIKTISLSLTKKEILTTYRDFVHDETDAHVVAGASKERLVGFLLTHNLRHYKVDMIKTKLGILVIKPGNFLQYFRSQEKL